MPVVNGWGDKNPMQPKIRPETPPRDFQSLIVDLPCPLLNCEDGFQFHDRKTGD